MAQVNKHIDIKDRFKVLTPDTEDMWLFNEGIEVFSKEVTMPLNGDESVWVDVTDEFKKEWEKQHRPE